MYINNVTFFITEALTPLVLSLQKQFNFEYIIASATANGKVGLL